MIRKLKMRKKRNKIADRRFMEKADEIFDVPFPWDWKGEVSHKGWLAIEGEFTANDLRKIADCLDHATGNSEGQVES